MFIKSNVIILLYVLNGVIGKTPFCDQDGILDSIFTNEIYTDKDNNTFSRIEIIAKEKYIWDLKTKQITETNVIIDANVMVRIFIGQLPVCKQSSNGDCTELAKLSGKLIVFSQEISSFRYQIKHFPLAHHQSDCNDCPLPWNMSWEGDPTEDKTLWPENWITSEKPVAAYDPILHQLVFLINRKSFETFDNLKVKRKSLVWSSGNNWRTADWTTDEMQIKYQFIGMVTLLAVNKNNVPLFRPNMNRIFAFALKTDSIVVYEYNQGLAQSDYSYRSLFRCPQRNEPSLLLYLGIGGLVILVILIGLIIIAVIKCCRTPKETTRFRSSFGSNSSSGGIGSRSSDSFGVFKKKSSNSPKK